MSVQKLNRYELFKAKNVIKEELEKGNVPEFTYYRSNENDPYTIYVIRKDVHKNGGDFHDYVAHAKRESLVKQKLDNLKCVIEMYNVNKCIN